MGNVFVESETLALKRCENMDLVGLMGFGNVEPALGVSFVKSYNDSSSCVSSRTRRCLRMCFPVPLLPPGSI